VRADLHTHSSVSDGTEPPAVVIRRGAEAGLDVIALTDHDTVAGVREAAVFGVPDEHWGQRVCAAYVAEGPASRRASVEETLRAAASARLAPYKRPKTYLPVSDLPHTATGKLMRRAVPAHLGLTGEAAGQARRQGG